MINHRDAEPIGGRAGALPAIDAASTATQRGQNEPMAEDRARVRVVGWSARSAHAAAGFRAIQVYEARSAVVCGRCGRAIRPGESFTRGRAPEASGPAPTCRACRPFLEPLGTA